MANPVGSAVYAKVRTRFGKRLTAAQFRDMCALGSVGEIAEFLKGTERYRAIFRESGGNIHRDFLEKLIKKQASADILELCAYLKNTDKTLSEIIAQKAEIDQLLIFLRYFFAGRPKEYALSVSFTVNKTAEIDLLKLSDVETVEQLNAVLKGTQYHKWLASALSNKEVSFSEIEAALLKAYFSNAHARLLKEKKVAAAQILAKVCEISDISLMYRINRYYNADRRLLDYAHKITCKLKKDRYDRLIKAENEEQFATELSKTAYGNIENFTPQKAIQQAQKEQMAQSIKNIHFLSDSPAVLLSYAFYCNAEVSDVIHIIEGVRYKLSPDEILKRLQLYEIIRGENDG